jgi:hypothetical protein
LGPNGQKEDIFKGELSYNLMSRKYSDQSFKEILGEILPVFLEIIILSLLMTFVGVCLVHETGHYFSGRLLGCGGLEINCNPGFSTTIHSVSGWDSCKEEITITKDNSRVCNSKTTITLLSGFLLSLLVFSVIVILSYLFLKRKYYFMKESYLIIGILFVFAESFREASFDFAKILECYLPNVDIILFGNQSSNLHL